MQYLESVVCRGIILCIFRFQQIFRIARYIRKELSDILVIRGQVFRMPQEKFFLPPPNEIFFICTPQLRVCPRGNFAPLCWKILSSPLRRILFTPPFGSKSPSPTPKFAKKFSPTPENFFGPKILPPQSATYLSTYDYNTEKMLRFLITLRSK